ncbi:hypothetical protein ACO0K3_16655 [Undibacterium sp. Rencai35W]|uniref:hypothetical protein n=1 Tax=Undibacterium sp. Rencai35W TaxID=3413046 RepID=UPI003BF01621
MKISLLTTLFATLLLATTTSQAATPAPKSPSPYAEMCMTQGIKMPVEYGGEADLKGNPKLQEYCECFSELFTERATRAAKNAGNPPPLEQSMKEEKQMRTTCRAKFNLPAPK